jgi:2-octaprenyl-6-methoxyphenol hydroxylase
MMRERLDRELAARVRAGEQADRENGKRHDYDVAIVGGGIAGATLACALQRSGLQVVLIEAEPQSQAVAKGQAYNLSPLSSRIFAGIGIWADILPQIETYQHIHLSDHDYSGVVQFTTQDLGTPTLGYVAEHRVLLTALQTQLAECAAVLCPAKVLQTDFQPEGVRLEVLIEGTVQSIWTRLVVAADGSRSLIRQQAGIRTRGWQYWQSCIVATVKPEKSHSNTAYERFQPSGPFAILPIPGNRCRIVWTAPHQEAAAIMAWEDDKFLAELTQRFGNQMGQLTLEGARYVFPVQLMQSDRYVQPRLALIGDAAHCCHPVGGQGMNMGIRDAAALAQVLHMAQAAGEDIADLAVLRRYERWRKAENWIMLAFTDVLDRTFSTQFFPIVVLRRLGLWMLAHIFPVKSLALRLMTGFTGKLPQLAER